jgi:DNA-binding CsgD family transcriptional regulator
MIGILESFERIAVPVCAVNYHRRIVAWNTSAENLFGILAEDAVGREWHSVIHTVGTAGCCALCTIRRALSAGEPAEPVEARISVDGYHLCVTMLPVPLGTEEDAILGFMLLPAQSTIGTTSTSKTPIPISPRVVQLDDRIVENLTTREREVLACVVEGFDARTIAQTVGITHATARNYVQRILTKLGARNKAEAVNVALRYNLIAS